MSAGVVVVGAGLAGARVASHLREHDFDGRIRILGEEPSEPYDRPVLSKKFMADGLSTDDFLLYKTGHFAEHDIEFRPKTQVDAVDAAAQVVRLADGEELTYDSLVWCAGGRVRRIATPGVDSADVYYLRTTEDAGLIRDRAATARRAVVVGGGFTGLEIAASLSGLGLTVTVLEVQPALLERSTSAPISNFLLDLHRLHGVDVRLSTQLREIDGDVDGVRAVVVDDGERIECDMVVVGVGIVPNVEQLAAAGAVVSNGVDIDEQGRTSLPNVYAAGDCVNFESRWTRGRRLRLESVQSASAQATIVAAEIAGVAHPGDPVPWFWSNQHGATFKAVGLRRPEDRAVVRHDAEAGKISVVYLEDDLLVAVDTVNNVRDYAQGRKLLEKGVRLHADRLGDISVSLTELVK